MSQKSFFDLDYIIEINEKRLEGYHAAYQKNLDKFTNLLVIYSALSIFLIPIIKDFIDDSSQHWIYWFFFILFIGLFITSIAFTIRLLIPVEVAYLVEPKRYYSEYLIAYQKQIGNKEDEVNKLLKASYIDELEKAVTNNNKVFKRKGFFYYRAFILGIVAALPYLICLSFHFSKKQENIEKVELINMPKNINFEKNKSMPDTSNTKNNSNQTSTSSSSTTSTTTQLPGVNTSQVIPSNPQMIKENFNDTNTKSGNKK